MYPLDYDLRMFATKLAGKPYAGKPHVRFDEGATEQNDLLCTLLYYDTFENYLF
jgi:extradiol dioxygenase family protein